MDYFPVFAKLRNRPCLVVGGGAVAGRKVRQLLKSGARVTVNAPVLNEDLRQLASEGRVTVKSGPFDPLLIEQALLVIAATSDTDINREVANTARRHNRLCNVVDDGEASGFIMPSVIDRSPIVVAISSGGRSPALARIVRQQIDEWLPSRIGMLARWAGKWRDTVHEQIKTHDGRIRFWQRIFDGKAAQQFLAGDVTAADQNIAVDLKRPDKPTDRGEAWIVGAGPGDPDLITRRGSRLLQRADAVLHDRLIAPELLELARRDAEIICVGKQANKPSIRQEEINQILIDLVGSGKRVCRLKGGDPFIFGRGGEEISALAKAGLPYQVVPGISAANGCAAAAGIPLTHRDLSSAVTLITGHRADQLLTGATDTDWSKLAAHKHTLVFYMGFQQLERICQTLIHHGLAASTPAAMVQDGTTHHQRVVGGTLKNIVDRTTGMGSPAVLIVGEVVALADKLGWHRHSSENFEPISARLAT
jgi:uroporphyrin-III C-methyltransferase/precorrin-2 dehydrogenase/sirohydrochlorin ferrochelatase